MQVPAAAPGAVRAELGATLRLAWPLVLANLTTQIIQGTDAVLLGRLGAVELASAALALGLTFAIILFVLGVLTASAPLMANALGARSNAVREVRRSFRQALWASAILVIPVMLLLANAEAVILALGQEPRLAAGAQEFLHGSLWGLPAWCAFQVMRTFLSVLERPAWVLAISAGGIFINAALGFGFIFGEFGLPAWGLFGAGIAASSSWWIMATLLAIVLLTDRQFRRFHLFGRWWRPDWPRLRRIFALGLPIGATMAFEGAIFSGAAYVMGLFGALSVAAHQVALQIAATSFMVPLGLAQAATVRVGLALGRGDRAGIARAGWTAFLLGIAFMSLMAGLMWIAPRPLVTLFLPDTPANAEVIALAVSFLAIAALFQIVDGAQVVAAGMLRGLQDTRVPMLIALCGYWGVGTLTGLALAFPAGWRGLGIWSGLAIGLAFVAVLMLWRWTARERFPIMSSARP